MAQQQREDVEWAALSAALSKTLSKAPRQHRARVEAWCKTISIYLQSSKTRNSYARLLLQQVESGKLEEPFHVMPPVSGLPPFPSHLRVKLGMNNSKVLGGKGNNSLGLSAAAAQKLEAGSMKTTFAADKENRESSSSSSSIPSSPAPSSGASPSYSIREVQRLTTVVSKQRAEIQELESRIEDLQRQLAEKDAQMLEQRQTFLTELTQLKESAQNLSSSQQQSGSQLERSLDDAMLKSQERRKQQHLTELFPPPPLEPPAPLELSPKEEHKGAANAPLSLSPSRTLKLSPALSLSLASSSQSPTWRGEASTSNIRRREHQSFAFLRRSLEDGSLAGPTSNSSTPFSLTPQESPVTPQRQEGGAWTSFHSDSSEGGASPRVQFSGGLTPMRPLLPDKGSGW